MPAPRPAAMAAIAALALCSAPAAAQPAWIQVTAPHVTVVSDAGAGRARDIAWQFEQVHQGLSATFPWIRWNLSRPLLVLAARNEGSMKALVPGTFARPDGRLFTAVASSGRDRAYVALRADVRIDDVEGVNPYQSAYWAYASQALGETFTGLPLWLQRGLAEFMSNSLVRDKEIQIGRVLPQNLRLARGQTRLALRDLVALGDDDRRVDRPQFLADVDATAWAFVHFLMFGDDGVYQPKLNAFIAGLLKGGNPQTLLTSSLGDVSRYENAFNVYVNREIFGFARFDVAARLSREGFPAEPLPAVPTLLLRASHHVSTGRLDDARALVAEARKADPAANADEVEALVADRENRDDDLRASLEKAVKHPNASWYAPYRLATLLSTKEQASLERVETLLDRATTLNPFADAAWAYLAEVMAYLDRGNSALGPSDKAIGLVPASSHHHVSRARVLRRLGRPADASSAAGIGRALARTPEERQVAQAMLGELARDALDARAKAEAASAVAAKGSESTPVSGGAAPAAASGAAAAPPSVDAALLAGATRPADGASIGYLVDSCFANPATCRKALPEIAGDCNAGDTPTSPGACRNAGYILDAGIGVPAAPVMAADFYRKGCARKDEISCVRLATLQALGRGVPRDVAAGLGVLEASCKNDVQEACFRLGVHLASTKLPADFVRAREVLTASCKAEFPESCARLKTLPPG